MISNVMNSASSMINHAQQKAASAAQTIAKLPVQEQEVGGSKNVSPADPFKPVLSLKEAEFETMAATKVIKSEQERVGSMLDALA